MLRVLATGRVVAIGLAGTWTPDALAAGRATRTIEELGLAPLLD